MKQFVLPLSDSQADLETVGGKGMSLAKLAQAGFPVPGGFHVTTAAYREFVAANDLQPRILEALEKVEMHNPAAFEAASQLIGKLFAGAEIPDELVIAIVDAYTSLEPWAGVLRPGSQPSSQPGSTPVAVRSSATAEDLPGASFAGQQETYLNVHGADAVIEATRKCWASLWTARAIAYRLRQGIPPESVALAVVIQALVPAEAAGILFTANPLTGKRSEAVINAAWGLGEAIVGGAVTPDTIIVEKSTGRVVRSEISEKLVMTVRTDGGTEEQPVPEPLRQKPVLSDTQATGLTGLGSRIEQLYGMPMDIEWALVGGQWIILQARPVTALPEAPIEWAPPDPRGVYMRSSITDLMPVPLSPLFRTLGIPALREQMGPVGMRLLGSSPVTAVDYFTSINTYAYMNSYFPPKAWIWILFKMLPAFPRLLRRLVPIWRDELHPEYLAFVAGLKEKVPSEMTVGELWTTSLAAVNAAMQYSAALMFATMGASAGAEMLCTTVYDKLAKKPGDPPASTLLMGWDNIPVRAEKSLYDLAMWCRERPELAHTILETGTGHLAEWVQLGLVPEGGLEEDWRELHKRFQQHLERFGHIVFQMDFAENLPLDHPKPMLENIKMYLRGEGTNPHERQHASEQKRIQTGENVIGRLKGFRRWVFNKALKAGQTMAEVREDALAEIGLGYPILRKMLHELGGRFTETGIIERSEDIFWLEKEEIDALVAGRVESLAGRVAERKAFNSRVKKETPPSMIPMKERVLGIKTDIFVAQSADTQKGNTLRGVPTSPGVVTAPAQVMHGPDDFERMRPGEVLVAGTTTPAWTSLFTMASAVVTDIGGPLSHGSIVAREYGIPAVMGTGVATKRIQSGQIITVDGNTGIVTLG